MTSLSATIVRGVMLLAVFTFVPAAGEARADVLSRIAQCESHGNQFNAKGEVLRNPYNSAVVGVFQLNEHYHAAPARRMGLDIYTRKGNWEYARRLYQKYGITPWLASKQCLAGREKLVRRSSVFF